MMHRHLPRAGDPCEVPPCGASPADASDGAAPAAAPWVDPERPVLEQLEALSERTFLDIDFSAIRRYRESGPERRVIGCFPVYVPEELVHAAGFLPAHIHGGGQMVGIDHADARIQSFVCAICRSTLELGLRGMLEDLDGFLFPSICDVARNLSGVWKRNFPDQLVAYCHWPEHADSVHAHRYLRREFARIAEELGELRGAPLTAEELNASLEVYNENRRLLREMHELRRSCPERLGLAESYRLFRAGGFMRREEHNGILVRALAEARARQARPRDAVRVLLEGSFCERIPVEVLQMIEDAGCYVLDDDLFLGMLWYPADIPADTEDPLGAMAAAFLAGAEPCSIHHVGRESRVSEFGRKLERIGAAGVIFSAAKFCEPALYDYVPLKEEVERRGLPYVTFEFEEKMTVFDAIQTQVETFVESVLFFGEEVPVGGANV